MYYRVLAVVAGVPPRQTRLQEAYGRPCAEYYSVLKTPWSSFHTLQGTSRRVTRLSGFRGAGDTRLQGHSTLLQGRERELATRGASDGCMRLTKSRAYLLPRPCPSPLACTARRYVALHAHSQSLHYVMVGSAIRGLDEEMPEAELRIVTLDRCHLPACGWGTYGQVNSPVAELAASWATMA